MHNIDLYVQHYFSMIRTPFTTELMYLLTILFDFSIHFVLLAASVTFLIYLFRGYRHAVLFGSSIMFGGLVVLLLKYYFNVARPMGGVMEVFGASFPSGHATVSAIFFVMLMYIFHDILSGVTRTAFNLASLFLILLISFSRVYLGVHWVSDVAFGILLGGLLSWISIYIFKKSYQQGSL